MVSWNRVNFLYPKLLCGALLWYLGYLFVAIPILAYGLGYFLIYIWKDVFPVDPAYYNLFGDRPNSISNLPVILTLERCDPDDLRNYLAEKLMHPHFEKLRYRFVDCFGRMVHKLCQRFDPKRHIFQSDSKTLSKDDLMAEIAKHSAEWWDDDKPRWKIEIYPNYLENQTAIIFLFHHTLIDGVSVFSMLLSMMKCQGEPNIPQVNNVLPLWKRIFAIFAFPFLYSSALNIVITNQEEFCLQKHIQPKGQRVSNIETFDVSEVRSIAKKRNTTVGILLSAAIIDSMKKCSIELSGKCPEKIKTAFPVGFRSIPNDGSSLPLGNFYNCVFPTFSTSAADIISHCAEEIHKVKNSLESYIIWKFIFGYSERFGTTEEMRKNVWNPEYPPGTAVCISNIAGPRCQTTLLGKDVDVVSFFVAPWNNTVNAYAITGWGNQINVAFGTDEIYGIDPKFITQTLRETLLSYAQ
mmetsp:Transcript_62500/g.71705  ORF Transcript_62500/g.71705 Transcript_62500/m.71705 type:complete len:466 (-) Transcript_62500:137-1534(-)